MQTFDINNIFLLFAHFTPLIMIIIMIAIGFSSGLAGAPACGDVMKLDLKLDPDTDEILDVKFKTYGCGSAIASSTMFVEMLKGKTLEQAKQIKDKEIAIPDNI